MGTEEKRRVLQAALGDRSARWQKVPRAFENAFVRFEITMNIGAWRDLHRHRMLTQERQEFTCEHGYEIPREIIEAGLEGEYRSAIGRAEDAYMRLDGHYPEAAQYAVTLAHLVRFMQYENLRECFWETELRTIPEGHPDYRAIEQEKFRAIQMIYPLIAEFMMVNMGQYDFARRGQEERAERKLKLGS